MSIDPVNAPLEIVKEQDIADNKHIRLTSNQANILLRAPGTDTLPGLRDTALIALMLCTGIREGEAANVYVSDLREKLGQRLALRVRRGKGAKSRLIPYGQLDWCLAIVDAWLSRATITQGPVFRGFYKGNATVRANAITPRAIQNILKSYPLMIDGALSTVTPHDLRRAYAKLLYDSGMDLLAIKDNMGHANSKTTIGYIGAQNIDKREPAAIYTFDLSSLTY